MIETQTNGRNDNHLREETEKDMKTKSIPIAVVLIAAIVFPSCGKSSDYSVRGDYEAEAKTVYEALREIDYDEPSSATILIMRGKKTLFKSTATCGFDGEKTLTIDTENYKSSKPGGFTAADMKAEAATRITGAVSYYLYPSAEDLLSLNDSTLKKAEQEKKASFTYLYRITFQERAVKDGMTMFTPYYNDIEDVLGVDATVTSSPILTQIDGTLSCGGAAPYDLTFRLVYRIATRIVA